MGQCVKYVWMWKERDQHNLLKSFTWCSQMTFVEFNLPILRSNWTKRVKIKMFSVQLYGASKSIIQVSLRIQSECGKIQTRTIPNTGTFHVVRVLFKKFYFILGTSNNFNKESTSTVGYFRQPYDLKSVMHHGR